jgi:hypothetical protein
VIGVDINDAMLVCRGVMILMNGGPDWISNTKFVRAKIQDLALDLDALNEFFKNPITTVQQMMELRRRSGIDFGET